MTSTSGRSRSTRRPSAPPCSFAKPTRRCASTRADPPTPEVRTSTSPPSSARWSRRGADAAWVGWGFVAERPEFAELCERLGIVFIGPGPAVMRRLGDKIEAKRLAEQSDVPVAPWSGGPVESVEDARSPRRRDRVPPDDQGHRGRRRPGHPARRCRRRAGRGLRQRPGRRPEGVRRCDRLHGAGRDRCPPRRGAGDGRPPWHGVGGRGPRLQPAAAQPEGDRGVAVHRADARRGSRSASRRHPPRHGRRIRERRDRRVPLPAGDPAARVPRGEHPPPGGAPRHRADDWARPREAADPRGQRRSAGGRPTRHRRLRHRGPAERRRPPARVRAGARHDRHPDLPGRSGTPGRYGVRRGRRDPRRVRLDDRQGHLLRQNRDEALARLHRALAQTIGARAGRHDEQVVPARPPAAPGGAVRRRSTPPGSIGSRRPTSMCPRGSPTWPSSRRRSMRASSKPRSIAAAFLSWASRGRPQADTESAGRSSCARASSRTASRCATSAPRGTRSSSTARSRWPWSSGWVGPRAASRSAIAASWSSPRSRRAST